MHFEPMGTHYSYTTWGEKKGVRRTAKISRLKQKQKKINMSLVGDIHGGN